jgi:septal ring factor EnvC (AmiA/AmiB activator)
MTARGTIFAATDRLYIETCCACGVLFAMPEDFNDRLRETGTTFYCPNGHRQSYNSEIEKLKRDLDAERTRTKRLREEVDNERNRHAATKGQLTKLQHRADRGVCPHCHRSFVNVARHVETKHPRALAEQ